jgi:lysylphosphatidylglycerol synthetase-like protein (DUF2156 family)
MKKALKYVFSTIGRGFLILIPLLVGVYLLSKLVYIANLIFEPLSNILIHKSCSAINTAVMLVLLFVLGLITKVKFIPNVEQIIMHIPIISYTVKYLNKMRNVMDIAKKRGVVFICENSMFNNMAGFSSTLKYSGKSFAPALIAGEVCCKDRRRFKIINLGFHTPFKMTLVDGDTKILATLNWNSFLKYWPVLGTIDVQEMEKLEECSLEEYWNKIYSVR